MLFISLCTLPGFSQNLQTYTPSILFGPGDWEYKSFQNLYRQTKSFGGDGGVNKVDAGDAQVFFTSINQFLYGVNSQLNIGLDVWVNHTSLPFGSGRDSQTGISLIGPKVKIAPFKSLNRLSIQSSYLFPATSDMENRAPSSTRPFFFFANDRSLWLTQFSMTWRSTPISIVFFSKLSGTMLYESLSGKIIFWRPKPAYLRAISPIPSGLCTR